MSSSGAARTRFWGRGHGLKSVRGSRVSLSPDGPQAATETTGRSVIVNGLWNSFSQSLPQAFSLIISIAAARFLGPSGMGRQSFIAFTMISVSQVIGEGMNASLMRSIGQARGAGQRGGDPRARALGPPILLLGGSPAASCSCSPGCSAPSPRAAWVLAGVECVLLVVQGVPWAVLTGSQKWRQASSVGLVTGVLGVPLTIGVLAAGGGIVGMFACETLIAAAAVIAITVLARRALRALPDRVDPALDLRPETGATRC